MASILDGQKQFHLQISAEEIGRYVILPGDPGRVPRIARLLDDPHPVAANREYTTYTGTLSGEKVSVVSTTTWRPLGSHRGGGTGALRHPCAYPRGHLRRHGYPRQRRRPGDCAGSRRAEGTSREYLPEGYPATASFDVITALAQAAQPLSSSQPGAGFHVGVVQSKDSFYGETNPETMPVASRLEQA